MGSRREHVFLVRMWTERSDGDHAHWRGSIRHVESGQNLFITAAAEITDFVNLRLRAPSVVDAAPTNEDA